MVVLFLKRIYIYFKNLDYFGSLVYVIFGKYYMVMSEVEVLFIFIDDVNVIGICKEYINIFLMEYLGFFCFVKNLII